MIPLRFVEFPLLQFKMGLMPAKSEEACSVKNQIPSVTSN